MARESDHVASHLNPRDVSPRDLSQMIYHVVEDKSAQGIAAAVGRLISSNEIHRGEKLPTVRDLSSLLGVSHSTVNQAWQALALSGALISRGRAGTFVAELASKEHTPRFLGLGGPLVSDGIDLSRGTPDPELLPSLAHALECVTANKDIWASSYFDEPIVAELDALLRETWPFTPERLTVVDGALDALSRVVDQLISFGDRVVVESPGFPPLLDLLERAGAELIPVSLDEQGIMPSELANALQLNPTALFTQPRAHNPTGTSMSKLRASELATFIGQTPCWVIEDDHSGDISISPDVSIGLFLPARTVHIRSFSKSHGPDLRLAAMGGPSQVLDPIINRRMLGPGWSSRLLQHILVELLTNPVSIHDVEAARAEYVFRSTHFREALADLGLVTSPGDGINVFISVDDEQRVLINLAAQGVRVAPGAPFFAGKTGSPSIRVTTAALPSDPERISEFATLMVKSIGQLDRMHSSR